MTPSLSMLLFPVLFAGALAAATFNRPSWLRSYTTWLRFRMSIVMYAGLYVIVLLVAYIPLRAFGIGSGWPPALAGWCAFAATVCVRLVPGVDDWIRRWIYRLADIPVEARERAASLVHLRLRVSDDVKARAAVMMHAAGLPQDCGDWIPRAKPLLDQLKHATWLFVQLREWDDALKREREDMQRRLDSRFGSDAPEAAEPRPTVLDDLAQRAPPHGRNAFLVEAENDLFRLRQRFDAILFRISRMLASIELLGQVKHAYTQHAPDSDEIDEPLRRMIESMISDSCESVARLYNDLCLLATRGIYATEWTRIGRKRAFKRLGFVGLARERTDIYLVLALAGTMLFLALWLYFLKQGSTGSDLTMFQLAFLIVFIQMGAVAIATHAKLHFGFANGGLHQRTPWGYIAALGACALLLALVVNAIAGAVMNGMAGAITRLRNGWPWLPVAITTATLLAWLIQDYRWRRIATPMLRRACDAAAFGVGWGTAGFLAMTLQGVSRGLPFVEALQSAAPGALAICATLGATLGALIPERVRFRPDAVPEREVKIPDWFATADPGVHERMARMAPDA